MATINHVHRLQTTLNPYGQSVIWETVTETNATGSAFNVAFAKTSITFQAIGTIGGATLTFQGSLDGTNWFTLKTSAGLDATLTAAGGLSISNLPIYVRPSSSGGSGSDMDILCFAS